MDALNIHKLLLMPIKPKDGISFTLWLLQALKEHNNNMLIFSWLLPKLTVRWLF